MDSKAMAGSDELGEDVVIDALRQELRESLSPQPTEADRPGSPRGG